MKYRLEWSEKQQLTHFANVDESEKTGWAIIAENEDDNVLFDFCEALYELEEIKEGVPFKTDEVEMLWYFYDILLYNKINEQNGKISSNDL